MEKYEVLKKIKDILIKNHLTLSSAESCTGGLVSSYLTDISGASEYIYQNFVTYSNDAKIKYLGVSAQTLNKYGAVSSETAYEMSEGLLKLADCSIATTGILGPTGFTKDKPIGLVYISLGYKNSIKVIKYISKKTERYQIKQDIVEHTLYEFLRYIEEKLRISK